MCVLIEIRHLNGRLRDGKFIVISLSSYHSPLYCTEILLSHTMDLYNVTFSYY